MRRGVVPGMRKAKWASNNWKRVSVLRRVTSYGQAGI